MADTTQSAKSPWHLWVVGAVSLLWNAMGVLDFTMTQTRNEAYLKQCTPEQLAYVYDVPFWVLLTWGVGTWGSGLGSLLLLLRNGLAVPLFFASFIGMVFTFTYNYVFSDWLKVMGGGVGNLIFSGVIFVIALLLLVYARAMRRRGALR